MWTMRGLAAASVLVLAACGGSEPRGELSVVPRPELTAPPGEMSVRLLFMVNALTASESESAAGKTQTGKWGTIGLADGGVGVTISADLRNAAPGTYQLKLLDEASCSGLVDGSDGEPDYVETVDSEPLRLPAIAVDGNGEAKRDYSAGRLGTSDFRGKAIVLMAGNRPVACGSAVASRLPVPPKSEKKKPEGASSDGGRPGDGK